MTEHDWRRGFDKRTDCVEWSLGYRARCHGIVDPAANPYAKHTTENWLWNQGWQDADEEMDSDLPPAA